MKEDYAHNTCKGTIDSEDSRVTYDENGRYFYGGGSRTSRGNSTCSKTFEYSCVPSKTSGANRPIASAGGGYVAGDGFGTINIEGIDSDTLSGLRGYLVWTNIAPTKHDSWRPLDNNNEDTASVTTGMYFVSVITNDDVISYPTTVTIHVDDLSTTANISLRDTTGNQAYNVNTVSGSGEYGYKPLKNSQYTLLNNNLKKESVFANGFDLLTSAYEVTVEANKIAVYATLTSDDASYVDGYGPRTVSLNYGRNIILVKIKNNEGKERTYTFIVNRTDTRNNFNLITELTTSVGKLNFDRYVSDYRIEVPADTKTVDINAKIESLTGSFVKGYEPRTVELKEDITSAVLKTVSDADIVRSYLLTFVKKGSEVDDSIDASTYLSSLTIPGTEIKFDKDVTSYNVAVPYETENIEVFAYAESNNAVVDYIERFTLQPGPNNLELTVKNGPEPKIYNVFINRKEDTIGVTNSTKLATLTVQDYDLKFKPDIKDYTVKIRNEKTLLLTVTPESNRSEVYMYGNNDLTAYSTIRIKVIAEDGTEGMYSVDIVKALFNKDVERVAGGGAFIITKRIKHKKEYLAN